MRFSGSQISIFASFLMSSPGYTLFHIFESEDKCNKSKVSRLISKFAFLMLTREKGGVDRLNEYSCVHCAIFSSAVWSAINV